MTARAWRIVKAKHAAGAFSGLGARLYGGRWNSPGSAVAYASGSLPLAVLEMLVHLESEELLKRYVVFELTYDSRLATELDVATLPRNWKATPPPHRVQRLGDQWIAEGRSVILKVPSAILGSEWNCLINPLHPDFAQIRISPGRPLRLDPRLRP